MSAEGIRPSRFAARNARWSHNHRVAWPPESGSPDDVAVPGQGSPVQVPHGNGHANGNGHAHGNGRANGNGHAYGNGPSRMLNVTLSEDERERLKAEVVYWGMQQAQQGRVLTESDLQAEYDRRLSGAQHLLGDLEADVQARYDHMRAAERMVREREESDQRARFAQPQPRPYFELQPPLEQPEPRPYYEAQPSVTEREPSSKIAGVIPKPVVSRRNALKLIGLLGLQGAAAVGTVKVMDQRAQDTATAVANNPNGIPQAVIDAGGGPDMPDPSGDTDLTKVNQPVLAAFNNGQSLFSPFPGTNPNPNPANLALLKPAPALPARPGRVRQFTLTAEEKVIQIAKGIMWAGWMYNGTIPGPFLRVTQGDTVHVTLINKGKHPHSIHFHSVHPGTQDGVFQIIPAGGTGTYTFTAEPYGVYPYHCHIAPFDQHVARGLYGMLIIDPPTPRPPANEMTMLLNGYDPDFSGNNSMYSVNGLPGYYQDHPIPLKIGQLNRIYVVNMTEHDELNSFHLHGNMFNYIPLGTALKPSFLTDVVHLGIADRGIIEFTYKYPGQYLFHAHQTELSMKGWSGIFNVS